MTALLTDLLRKCRDQFEFYGDQHLAKTPPQVDKAETNYTLVHEINAALLLHSKPVVAPAYQEEPR